MASTGTMTDYLAHMLLDASLSDGTWTTPTNVYLCLCTASVSATDTGSTITEPSNWSDYARKLFVDADFSAAASRAKTNAQEVEVDASATCGADEDLTHWAIADAASAGNLLWYGTLDGTITVQNGDPVVIPIGSLDLDISTALGTPA